MTASAQDPSGLQEPVAPSTEGAWRRMHPLTPIIRSWQWVAVVLVFLGNEFGQNLIRGEPSDLRGNLPSLGGRALTGSGLAVVALVVLVLAGLGLSWRFTRYRVTDQALEITSGVLSRRQRQAPLDRLQGVDVVQPLLGRVFGLARLTLEVAGGGDSKIELSYLTEAQAQQLRRRLLAGAAGLRYETAQAPEAPEQVVLEVPLQRLLGSMLLSSPAFGVLVILVTAVPLLLFTQEQEFALGILAAGAGFVSLLWRRLTSGFGFRVATSPDGLRVRYGLLEQRAQTVPPGRVQAVRLTQPWWWRPVGWWTVDVNIAGYGVGAEGESLGSVLLPVGTRDEAVAVLSFVVPDLGVRAGEHPGPVVDAGLGGTGTAGGFVVAPRRVRRIDPLGWRRHGVRATEAALLLRGGRLQRHLVVVPHARTQSCGLAQGPLQRALGVASFRLHSTPGRISPGVEHLTVTDAAALLADQAARARWARAAAGPERWMERSDPEPVEQPAEPAEGPRVE